MSLERTRVTLGLCNMRLGRHQVVSPNVTLDKCKSFKSRLRYSSALRRIYMIWYRPVRAASWTAVRDGVREFPSYYPLAPECRGRYGSQYKAADGSLARSEESAARLLARVRMKRVSRCWEANNSFEVGEKPHKRNSDGRTFGLLSRVANRIALGKNKMYILANTASHKITLLPYQPLRPGGRYGTVTGSLRSVSYLIRSMITLAVRR